MAAQNPLRRGNELPTGVPSILVPSSVAVCASSSCAVKMMASKPGVGLAVVPSPSRSMMA